ncbi:hypothetical protein PspLS_01305 [Pyricularia sp. CBS 133598]|nr:hypothetical protein PspLS_01305 [Pyricularia sp. CBS 133598]
MFIPAKLLWIFAIHWLLIASVASKEGHNSRYGRRETRLAGRGLEKTGSGVKGDVTLGGGITLPRYTYKPAHDLAKAAWASKKAVIAFILSSEPGKLLVRVRVTGQDVWDTLKPHRLATEHDLEYFHLKTYLKDILPTADQQRFAAAAKQEKNKAHMLKLTAGDNSLQETLMLLAADMNGMKSKTFRGQAPYTSTTKENLKNLMGDVKYRYGGADLSKPAQRPGAAPVVGAKHGLSSSGSAQQPPTKKGAAAAAGAGADSDQAQGEKMVKDLSQSGEINNNFWKEALNLANILKGDQPPPSGGVSQGIVPITESSKRSKKNAARKDRKKQAGQNQQQTQQTPTQSQQAGAGTNMALRSKTTRNT